MIGGGIAGLAVVALGFLPVASARAATNVISTVAGNGTQGFAGDGGPATASELTTPLSVSPTPDGGYLIADQENNRVRRVAPDGKITTVAGNGTAGASGDGGPATQAELAAPSDAEMMPDGSILIADSNNNEVRRVAPGGTITTVVGNGAATFSGDGGPAALATIRFPTDIAVASDGTYYISDNDNNRIRVVSPNGIINTYAGDGTAGSGGDGGQATQAELNGPSSVSLIPGGGALIAELDGSRIRRVATDGTITTVAGDGVAGFNGDNIAATSAELNKPGRVVAASDGSFLIADSFNNRIRRVSPTGVITTVAGTGTAGGAGDGGPATAAELDEPLGVAINAGNDYLIADSLNNRVRIVDAGDPPPPVVASVAPAAVLSSTAARFSGSVNPEGSPTTVHFVYGLDSRYRRSGGSGVVYDQSTSSAPAGSDFSAHPVSLSASGLVPNAVYHVQLVATSAGGTTRSSDETFKTAQDRAPAPPVLGQTVNVQPVSGLVLVKLNGRFVPLTEARQVPPGSLIDARRGALKLIAATSPKRRGKTQEVTLSGAVFKSAQARRAAQKGLTTITLIESAFPGAPSYAACGAGKAGDGAHAALSARVLQTLRATDRHGRFRTRGRFSAGTVRGTQWDTADRCDGTLTTVHRGSVAVSDFARHKTIIVRAGHHYLAKAKAKRK